MRGQSISDCVRKAQLETAKLFNTPIRPSDESLETDGADYCGGGDAAPETEDEEDE